MKDYYQRHDHKIHYVGYFDGEKNQPRASPKLFMWPADYPGQTHTVKVKQSYW
jgi:hypothetical protein